MTPETPRNIFAEVFGDILRQDAAQPEHEPTSSMVVVGKANAKLSQNLDLALDRQREILSQPITPETTQRDKRLSADVAHQVVRAAVSVDEQQLKRKPDDEKIARMLARLYEVRKQLELEGHVIPEIPTRPGGTAKDPARAWRPGSDEP
jgi:hypothetical protein